MLKSFSIQSFKSIVDLKIELGKLNVFIGANGSGKSNILEALGVLSAAAGGRVDAEALQRRGVRLGIPRLYKSAFPDVRMQPHISFAADDEQGATYSVSLNNPLEKPRPAWLFKSEAWSFGDKPGEGRSPANAKNSEQGFAALKLVEVAEDDPLSQFFSVLRDYVIFSPNTQTLRAIIPDWQSGGILGLAGGNLAEALDSLIKLAANRESLGGALEDMVEMIEWIREVNVAVPNSDLLSSEVPRAKKVIRFFDRYMREGKNSLTAYDASEGALYIIFATVAALHPLAPACFAVDNLDQALNPRLVKTLFRRLSQWAIDGTSQAQMLCTVHNPAVLDGLPLRNDAVRLFAVDRNSKGHTVIRRVLVDEKLEPLIADGGQSLSRLWVMGHLGAVPNV